MNEAYLKDIEAKNISIQPDVAIQDLMKQVTTFKLVNKAAQKLKRGINKKANQSTPDLAAKNVSRIIVGQGILDDTRDLTANTQRSSKKTGKTKKTKRVSDDLDAFSIGTSSAEDRPGESQFKLNKEEREQKRRQREL